MLGYTNAGKTTYLSSMLGQLFQGKVEGFSVRAANDANEAAVHRVINQINQLYSESRFPDATAAGNDITNLELSLWHGNNFIMDFSFIDYRGGAIVPVAEGNSTQEAEALALALLATDVVLVFTDAILLNHHLGNLNIARTKLGVPMITTILLQAVKKARQVNKELNIIFVLSKADASNLDNDRVESLKLKVEDLYTNFFTQVPSARCKVVEIGVVGRGQVETTVRDERNDGGLVTRVKNELIGYNHKPLNVVSLLALSGIEAIGNVSRNNAEVAKLLMAQKDLTAGFLNKFIDRVFRGSREIIRQRDLQEEFDKSNKALQSLSNFIPELQNVIRKKL